MQFAEYTSKYRISEFSEMIRQIFKHYVPRYRMFKKQQGENRVEIDPKYFFFLLIYTASKYVKNTKTVH